MKNANQLIDLALKIALEAHNGQLDRAGKAYILHPLRIMAEMQTDQERIVAILHDVIEDSDHTLEDLRSAGFPAEIVAAVDLLTHREEDSYEDYVRKILGHALARQVKIGDLHDNMRIDRLPNPDEKDLERLMKYKNALAILNALQTTL